MASGDTGSTCVSSQATWANRVSFPAGAPHAIAVGGTILQVGAGNSYQGESWWNDTRGAGGFGVSQHFPKPVWQNALPGSSVTGRSVPDVVADAGQDIQICDTFQNVQNCNIVGGGTSISAPFWAASWALVNQARQTAVSGAGGFLYKLGFANFHSAGGFSGPGNDFAHVGLGSPDLTRLIADIAGSPTIAGHTPGEATVLGGTPVTISGRNFIGVQSVTFPGGPTASPIVAGGSDQSITVLTPQLTYSLTGPIVIKTVAGQSAIGFSSQFAFGPSISNVQPSHGPTFGQTQVTVTGAGFTAQDGTRAAFSFGDVPVPSDKVSCTPTQCTLTTPPARNQAAGVVDVTAFLFATSPAGPQFRYEVECPTVTSIDPKIGRDIGNAVVSVFGSGLDQSTGSLAVLFGDKVGTDLYCPPSGFSCTVVTPPGTGIVPVTVIETGCPSAPQPPLTFTYFPTPVVSLVSPNHGPQAGNTPVTVTGSNFDATPGATQFNFGLTQQPGQASSVSCQSTTQCTMSSPFYVGADQNYVNPVDVVAIVSRVITSDVTVADEFRYDGKIKPPPCQGTTCQ
jgi:hypothetical protein